ncbi:MAG: helix-turn-helix domain-containing protein [Candidatus Hodarchaeota archaeon]
MVVKVESDEKKKKKFVLNEDEIFKSLSHKVRRDIVKFLGENTLTFTEIKNNLEPVDSPTLSYHLKSLEPLLIQKENKYELSEIGEAAFNLLSKTDESVRISRYKRKFLYAYYVTVICWISATTVIPFIISANLGFWTITYINIVITIISTINYVIVWTLRKKY